MYVARYTENPQYDEVRRWTAYFQPTGKTAEAVADLLIDLGEVTLPRRLADAYWNGDCDDAIAWVLDNVDIRFHEVAGLWMHVHNPNGLSCHPLDAETVEEAVEEARRKDQAGAIAHLGWGHVTSGNVQYVASVSDHLHIFWCDDVAPEA
jgi:hypothetical protein